MLRAMSTWTAQHDVKGRPEAVLDVLTDPDAVARWAPMPFEVERLDAPAPRTRHNARVSGCLAGRRVGFDVEVHEAEATVSSSPPAGPSPSTSPTTCAPATTAPRSRPRSPSAGAASTAALLAQATDALLAAGALDTRSRASPARSRPAPAPEPPLRRNPPPCRPLDDASPDLAPAARHRRPPSPPRDVTRRYGEGDAAVDALRGVSLDVPTGQFAAVMGPSGSGKSTLMHLLAGLDRPTDGHASTIGGEEITAMGDKELTQLRRDHIGFVFQAFNLLPLLTAEENILLPLTSPAARPTASASTRVFDARRPRATAARTGPAELSGGQQQRVAVARALVSRADGPLRRRAHGQPRLARPAPRSSRLLREAVDAYGQTTVMVTHDPRAAASPTASCSSPTATSSPSSPTPPRPTIARRPEGGRSR